jgi:protein-tyrosine kinase
MDDNSESPEGRQRPTPQRRERVSLVERAAGKMVTRQPTPSVAPGPAPAAAEASLPENDPLPEALERGGGSALLGGETVPEVVPQLEQSSGDNGAKAQSTPTVKLDFPTLQSRNIITPFSKRSRTVEEFRLIKRMVLSRRWDASALPGNAIVVTSALPSEGKTTTAINLAMSIAAEEDVRVLLIDADFIKPDALRQLGVQANRGLIDVLQDPRMDISDVMLRTDVEKLTLIPAGRLHDRCTELLASARMDDLITELATRYEDRILIFDSPPLLATTESVALASHMGQVVFVVQAGRTKRESVTNALEMLGERQHLGLVLNRTPPRFGAAGFGDYYGSYYYGYGHQEREGRQARG